MRGYVALLVDSLGPRAVDTVCYGPKNGVNLFRGVKDAQQALRHRTATVDGEAQHPAAAADGDAARSVGHDHGRRVAPRVTPSTPRLRCPSAGPAREECRALRMRADGRQPRTGRPTGTVARRAAR